MTPARTALRFIHIASIALALSTSSLHGQQRPLPSGDAFSRNLVLPHQRSYAPDSTLVMPRIASIDANVTIDNATAVTELTFILEHPFSSDSRIARESREILTADIPFSLLMPVPERATILGTRMIDLRMMPSTAVPTDSGLCKAVNEKFASVEYSGADAVKAYHETARQVANPNLLEFLGNRFVRCGNFNLSLDRACSFTLVYEEPLTVNGSRTDYVLPRSESFAFRRVPWSITVRIASPRTIAGIYSSSHPISIEQTSLTRATVIAQAVTLDGARPDKSDGSVDDDSTDEPIRRSLEPGSFRLSWLTGNELSASFISYSDEPGQEGYFLMMAGAPKLDVSTNEVVRREVILVIDRSGSMRGDKMEQVRQAALRILEELGDGEAFNIVDYADSVRQYSPQPVTKNRETLLQAKRYVQAIKDDGGTNIHDALVTALTQQPTRGYLPIVIFLTDGAPTIGVTPEAQIRDAVLKANDYGRRIYTFGVGYDVNAPLLDAIATVSKGTATFALPFDDVGEEITALFRRLNGPVFSDIELSVTRRDGSDASDLVADVLPAKINDVFDGDRIPLLGRYLADEPLVFTLHGRYLGAERSFAFTFDPARDRDPDAPWVRRLWTGRKINEDVVRIAQAGAVSKDKRSADEEARMKDLVKRIVRLSTANGIITEYTDYLAHSTTNVEDVAELERMADAKLRHRAQENRIGKGAVNQALNINSASIRNARSNRTNAYLDENLQVVEITSVQQIHDLTFFRRRDRWVDARILDSARTDYPARTIVFGTPEYERLIEELIADRRQGVLALDGRILLRHNDEIVLISPDPVPPTMPKLVEPLMHVEESDVRMEVHWKPEED